MVDRVKPLKLESPSSGGSQTDEFPTAMNPSEDFADVRGITFQNNESNDDVVRASRDASGNMTFEDGVVTGTKTLDDLLGGTGNVPKVLQFKADPTENGIIWLVGGYELTDVAEALSSGSPVTASDSYYNARIFITVASAVGAPFTIRVTGTSVSQTDGTLTPSDTEDINVTGDGDYSSDKYWVTAPQVSIVEGSKSCTVTLARGLAWNLGDASITIDAIGMGWTPDGTSWSIQLYVAKLDNDGNVTVIENVTFDKDDTPPRAGVDEPGRFYKSNYNTAIDGAAGEGLYAYVIQSRISELRVGVGYA